MPIIILAATVVTICIAQLSSVTNDALYIRAQLILIDYMYVAWISK